ncbi:MAG: pentapeptide repeat-containing protein [Candidatus Thiodiazotropha sp.]
MIDKEVMEKPEQNKPQSWFVKHDDMVVGPLTSARIRHLLLDGELGLSDQISPDRQSWQAISRMPSVIPLQLRAAEGDADAQAKVAARERADARDHQQERRFPLLSLTIALLLIGGAVLYSLRYGMPEAIDESACNAPPAPGVNWRNCLIQDLDAGAASLAGANLNSAVLRRAKLSTTDLSNADLRYANLSHGDLRHAQLQGAAMVGVNLQYADLRGADLSNADLRFADLTNSRIDDARLHNAKLGSALWLDGRSCGEGSIGKCDTPTD